MEAVINYYNEEYPLKLQIILPLYPKIIINKVEITLLNQNLLNKITTIIDNLLLINKKGKLLLINKKIILT